jgi:Pvc16 N-terminal domain
MSNALAIAAVTSTLRNLLDSINLDTNTGLGHVNVTTKPPDEARDNTNPNQVNLFLYQVLPNAAWRNMDIPQRVKSGESSVPPLALNLYYMLTTYGLDNDDTFGHRLLGLAMTILYDHPLLGAQEIKAALPNPIDSDLENQVERVRITLQPLSVDEIFRLWSGFQTQYRVSVAYEVAVVLIDSTRPSKTPLPVLTRGKNGRGVTSQADMTPPFPTLITATPPNQQTSIRLGETLTLDGFHLDVQNPAVHFTHQRLGTTQHLSLEAGGTANEVTVKIPANDPNNWPAGFYTVEIVYTRDDGAAATTNELSISLAPTITAIAPPTVTKDGTGKITDVVIQLQCSPAVQQDQHVALLLGDQEVPVSPFTATTQQLSFDAGAVPAGDYLVRLRVDGVDSLLIDRSVIPPIFDQTQKVTIA